MKRLLCLFVCTAAICSARAQGTTEAVLNYSPIPGSSLATGPMDGTIGWTFKPLVDIDVFALGAVQQSLVNQSLSVGLWNAGGLLLSSNFVTSSSASLNQSRYASITPLHLSAGQVYHIGAHSATGGTIDSVVAIAPGNAFFDGSVSVAASYIQWLGAAQSTTTTGFPFPAAVTQGQGWIYLGPNFQFTFTTVPEPSTLALFGLGALALVCRRKNR